MTKKNIPVLPKECTAEQAEEILLQLKQRIGEYGKKCLPTFVQLYSFSKQHVLPLLMVESLTCILNIHLMQRSISRQAQSWATKAERCIKEHNSMPQIAGLHSQLMAYYLYYDKIDKAKEHHALAKQVAQGQGFQEQLVRIRGVQLFMELEEHELAWEELFSIETENTPQFRQWVLQPTTQAISVQQLRIWQHIALISVSINLRFGDIVLAETYLEIAKNISNHTEDIATRFNILSIKADICLVKGDVSSLRIIAEELLKDYAMKKTLLSVIQANKIFTLLARHEKDYKKALFYAEIAYSYAQKGKDKVLRVHPTLLLTELLLKTEENLPRAKQLFEEIRPYFQQSRFKMLSKVYCSVGLLLAKKLNDTTHLQEYIEKLEHLERFDISPVVRGRYYAAKAEQLVSFIQNDTKTAVDVHRRLQYPKKNTVATSSAPSTLNYDNMELAKALKALIANISEYTVVGYQRSFIQKLQQLLEMLEQNTATSAMIQAVEHEIQRSQEVFLRQLARLCPSLTHSELKICIYLRLNLGTHDIANLLSISPYTVYTHRKRIRKKLAVNNKLSLHIYLLQIQPET